MKSLKDFNYLLSLDRRYTKTESEIFRSKGPAPRESASSVAVKRMPVAQEWSESGMRRTFRSGSQRWEKGRWAFGKAGKNLSRVGRRFF